MPQSHKIFFPEDVGLIDSANGSFVVKVVADTAIVTSCRLLKGDELSRLDKKVI